MADAHFVPIVAYNLDRQLNLSNCHFLVGESNEDIPGGSGDFCFAVDLKRTRSGPYSDAYIAQERSTSQKVIKR